MTKNTTLTASFLKEIADMLLLEKTKLEEDLSAISKKNPIHGDRNATFPEFGDEEDDNVQEIEAYTVNKPLEMSLENSLRDVIKALTRIQEGTYGICKYCDNTIDEKRLRARPTSSACVSCKKLLTDEA